MLTFICYDNLCTNLNLSQLLDNLAPHVATSYGEELFAALDIYTTGKVCDDQTLYSLIVY